MKSKISGVRTGSWAVLTLAGLGCLASACSSSGTSSGTGGAIGSGGATATGGSGAGGSGAGGSAAGGATGSGGNGAGGAKDAGGDAPADSGATDAVVVRDGSTNDAGQYVRAGWTAVAMPDHVVPAQTVPQSNESLASSNAFDGTNGTRWGTGV